MLLFVLHKMWLMSVSTFYIGVSLAPTYHLDIRYQHSDLKDIPCHISHQPHVSMTRVSGANIHGY